MVRNVVKLIDPPEIKINFQIAVDQNGYYQFMSALTPCYKLTKFNDIDQEGANRLPKTYLYSDKTNRIELIFSRNCPDPIYIFSIRVSPLSPNIDLDGYKSIEFTNNYNNKELKDYAFSERRYKKTLYIYIPDFDFINKPNPSQN